MTTKPHRRRPVGEAPKEWEFHARRIEAALGKLFPHTDVRFYPECVTILAGTDRWKEGGTIKTIPGGDDYTGIAIRLYPEEPGGLFIRIDELNVAEQQRGKGIGTGILRAIGVSKLRIYHSFDLSRGWWEHMHRRHPELFNREDLLGTKA
jgi:hypothetical protein